MPSSRNLLDAEFVRALRRQAASDPSFRESLSRVFTAEAQYESYVERKRKKGEPWLDREEWEAYVFGKGVPSSSEEKPPGPHLRPGDRRRLQQMVMRRRKDQGKVRMWSPSYEKGGRAKRLFSSEETAKLPQWATQTSGDRDRILAQAKEAQPLMVEWLNQGKGVDKAIGARTVRRDLDEKAPIDLDAPGPVLVIAPPKTEKAATDKVRRRYGGDWKEGAVDLVRATIAVDRYEDLDDVVEKLKESGIDLVSKPRNRFREATAAGYRDAVLNARLPNGHVMELQLHLKPVLKAKEQNHDLYSQIRGLAEEVGEGDELTQEARRLLDENTMRMRENYDNAWEEAVRRSDAKSIFDAPPKSRRRKSPATRKATAEDPLFFEVDGLPVRWEGLQLPRIHGGERTVPVDDLAWFAERAVPIEEQAFQELVDSREKRRAAPKSKKAFDVPSVVASVVRRTRKAAAAEENGR